MRRLARHEPPLVPLATAVSDAKGEYRLVFEDPPGTPARLVWVSIAGGRGAAARYVSGVFDTAESEELDEIALGPSARVLGRVVDAVGAPVAGADVFLGGVSYPLRDGADGAGRRVLIRGGDGVGERSPRCEGRSRAGAGLRRPRRCDAHDCPAETGGAVGPCARAWRRLAGSGRARPGGGPGWDFGIRGDGRGRALLVARRGPGPRQPLGARRGGRGPRGGVRACAGLSRKAARSRPSAGPDLRRTRVRHGRAAAGHGRPGARFRARRARPGPADGRVGTFLRARSRRRDERDGERATVRVGIAPGSTGRHDVRRLPPRGRDGDGPGDGRGAQARRRGAAARVSNRWGCLRRDAAVRADARGRNVHASERPGGGGPEDRRLVSGLRVGGDGRSRSQAGRGAGRYRPYAAPRTRHRGHRRGCRGRTGRGRTGPRKRQLFPHARPWSPGIRRARSPAGTADSVSGASLPGNTPFFS